MERARWNVSAVMGRTAQIRLVDASIGEWGYINFDDRRFEVKPFSTLKNPLTPEFWAGGRVRGR